MTFTAADWPRSSPPDRPVTSRGRRGTASVWRWELVKLVALLRVRAILLACLVVPFLLAGALQVQSAVPADTLFGQWVHESGFALPMVVVGFAGQWALPLVVAVIAGDMFSAEDHHGTWKMILTRSRTRAELFGGKVLAALTYSVVALAVLTGASLAAGLLLGREPVVGLSGQLVGPGHATVLVLLSWLLQLPAMLAFTVLAVALSVTSRNSVVGVGVPVLVGLVFQLLSLVDLPSDVRDGLLSTPFQSWHGLWTDPQFHDPVWHGLVTSGVWFVASLAVSWIVFSRRSVRVAS